MTPGEVGRDEKEDHHMNEKSSPMLERLQEFHARNPNDSFVLYGLAMELSKLDRSEEALDHFRKLVATDPGYVAAYQQAGMLLARTGRPEEAQSLLRAGIAAAARQGNSHAASEMQAALDELERGS